MKEIIKKLNFLYFRYVLIAFATVTVYTSIRWYFDIKLDIIHLKAEILDIWVPMLIPAVPVIIWLRRRIICLDVKGKKDNGYFAYQMVAAFSIAAPLIIAQQYIKEASYQLLEINSLSEIETPNRTSCYVLNDFEVEKNYAGLHQTSRASGKHNEHLTFYNYFVVPLVDNSTSLDNYNHKYWYAFNFTEKMSNKANQSQKEKVWNLFYKKSKNSFENYNYENFEYLKPVEYSDDRDGYVEAIQRRQKIKDESELVILEPIKESFDARVGNKFAWIFGSFGIGGFVFLIMVLFPSFDRIEYNRFVDKKPLREDDLKEFLKFLIPRREHFTTAILIDVNLIIFIIMVFSGISIVSPTGRELLEIGAVRRSEVLQGEYWRLFTAMFLHGGLMHIVMNAFGIGITCGILEPVFGKWKLLVAYLVSGIGGSLASIYWHENIISVGASGAIFGMIGLMIALLITRKDGGFRGIYLILIGLYGGVNLLLGIAGGIDNAAHIGGLLTGIFIGIILIISNWKKINVG
jgi:rhomboid protease GluP